MNKNIQGQYRDEIKEIENPIVAELTQITYGTPEIILNEYINREKQQNNEDIIMNEAVGYKNYLEQYIYDTRNKIDEYGELKGYYNEDEKKELIKRMDELMNWLYNKKELENKSKNMREIGDQIYNRFNEWNKLNEKYEKIESIINDTILLCSNEEEKIKKGKKTELSEEDISKIRQLIKDTSIKIAEKKNLSNKKELTELPPVFPDEIEMIINLFNENLTNIQNEAKNNKIQEENHIIENNQKQ